METNSDFPKAELGSAIGAGDCVTGLLPCTPAQSLLMELGFASQFRVRNLSAGVVKVPLSPIKAVLTAKASGLYRK